MSRIGQLPIPLPQGVTIDIEGSEVKVSGSMGELQRSFHPDMSITLEEGNLRVSRPDDAKLHRCLHGLTRTLLANMVIGVTQGFEKTMEIVGVGYRAQKADDKLVLQVGFSHSVEIVPPPGISFVVEGPNRVKVLGIDKELVGEMAARIRRVRPPDAYKGKGIR